MDEYKHLLAAQLEIQRQINEILLNSQEEYMKKMKETELLALELKELYHKTDYHKAQARIFEMTAREKANLMLLNEQALPQAAKKRLLKLNETSSKQVSPNSVITTEKITTEKLHYVEMRCIELEGRLKEKVNSFERQLEELKKAARSRNEEQDNHSSSLHKDLEQEKAELMEKLRNVEMKCLEQEGLLMDLSNSYERQLEELKKAARSREEEQDTRLRDAIVSFHKDLEERLKEQSNLFERQLKELKESAETRQEDLDAHLRYLEEQSFGSGLPEPEELKSKTISLLEEYFSTGLMNKAVECIKEIQSPSDRAEFVKEAINLGLDKNPPCVEPVYKLLEYLLVLKVLTPGEIRDGCWLYGSMIDDIAMNVPMAPNNFGEIMGNLILAGGLTFSFVNKVLSNVGRLPDRKLILNVANKVVSSIWS